MIRFLLFISIANFIFSLIVSPPNKKGGILYFSQYTNTTFRMSVFFAVLFIIF